MIVNSVDFRNSIANTIAVAREDIFFIDDTGKVTTTRLFRQGEKIGLATGYVYRFKETTGDFAEIYNSNKNQFTEVRIIYLDFVEDKKLLSSNWATAQTDLEKLLAIHAEIMDNLLASSSIAMTAERKGMNVDNYRHRIKQLYQTLSSRNDELINGGFLEKKESGTTALSEFSSDLNRVIQDKPAIGLAPMAVFLIKASVIATFAIIAYATIRILLTGGKSDLSEARKLVSEMSKLDPAQAKAVKEVLNKYYGSSVSNVVTYTLLAAGAFLGFKFLLPKLRN